MAFPCEAIYQVEWIVFHYVIINSYLKALFGSATMASLASIDDSHLTCGICLDIVEDAIETCCCHQLFCESCVKGLAACPMCRKSLNTTISHIIRRMVSNIEKPCDYCNIMFQRGNLKSHLEVCTMKPTSCIMDGCNFDGTRELLLNHMITAHVKELTNPNYKIVSQKYLDKPSESVDLICRKTNSFNRSARLGESGKYYCGGQLDTGCRCCDGFCGPTNGCNCTACFSLDMQSRNLPKGYFINKMGYPVRKGDLWLGQRRYYCGRKVMPFCTRAGYQTDGWCGDDDGENCNDCKLIQVQLETGGCYSAFVDE